MDTAKAPATTRPTSKSCPDCAAEVPLDARLCTACRYRFDHLSRKAVWSFVLWFVLLGGGLVSIVLGHMALNDIKRNPEWRGRGLALAGLILGYIQVAAIVLTICVFALFASFDNYIECRRSWVLSDDKCRDLFLD